MSSIYIKLKNCYGIPYFHNVFEFDFENKAHMIYAPNGIMKTSFANTFTDICKNQETKDCFYPDRETSRIVKYSSETGEDIEANSILVIEPYSDSYRSENASVLLANADLKNEYDLIHKDIDEKFKSLTSILTTSSGKRDTSELLSEDFSYSEKNYYECLENLYDKFFSIEFTDYSGIKYGKIISADSEKIFSDPDVIAQLNNYIKEYEKLLTNSKVFKSTYNHTNAEDSLSVLSKGGFFKAKHKVLLDGESEALNEKEFKAIIDNEKKRIIDTELADEFQKIDKLLSSKAATKSIRDFIFENREIIPALSDFNKFKQTLWLSYLLTNKETFQLAILNYKSNKKRLSEIIDIARSQVSEWNLVVLQFNERFSNMPFTLKITNKDDVILKSQIPVISFLYKDRGEEIEVKEDNLLAHLSNGEKKALYLLNIIFETEARKAMNKSTLIIMDDIADSFDYRNKYAIIEYIKDICDNELFMPILLTHNFDFYRTVAGRIDIKKTSNFVLKAPSEITLVHGQYFENVFDSWRSQVYNSNPVFISSIAFVRNIIEYTCGRKDVGYKNLTSLLHYKKNADDGILTTDSITVQDLIAIYATHWNRLPEKFKQTPSCRVIDIILTTAKDIYDHSPDPIHIENKIVLSIAIRLLAEQYMIDRINNSTLTDTITGNQTRILRDLIQFNLSDHDDKKIKEIIERVLIITSENIHINSFMYEPIVDMSLEELRVLYSEVIQFLKIESN